MAKILTITKEAGIKICIELLLLGKTRKEIVQTITKDYKISIPAVDKWIKAAKPQVEKRQKELEEIRIKETDAAVSDAVKKGLLSDLEIEAVLCRIVAGAMNIEEVLEDGVIIRGITPFEMINAARTIYQKRGSNAPAKTALTDAAGKDVKNFKISLNLG